VNPSRAAALRHEAMKAETVEVTEQEFAAIAKAAGMSDRDIRLHLTISKAFGGSSSTYIGGKRLRLKANAAEGGAK
jgi:ABC-type dipeptide/oligopeptide/nickel transport system permease component